VLHEHRPGYRLAVSVLRPGRRDHQVLKLLKPHVLTQQRRDLGERLQCRDHLFAISGVDHGHQTARMIAMASASASIA